MVLRSLGRAVSETNSPLGTPPSAPTVMFLNKTPPLLVVFCTTRVGGLFRNITVRICSSLLDPSALSPCLPARSEPRCSYAPYAYAPTPMLLHIFPRVLRLCSYARNPLRPYPTLPHTCYAVFGTQPGHAASVAYAPTHLLRHVRCALSTACAVLSGRMVVPGSGSPIAVPFFTRNSSAVLLPTPRPYTLHPTP
eukprot:1650972-Rhodomonas_salina.3